MEPTKSHITNCVFVIIIIVITGVIARLADAALPTVGLSVIVSLLPTLVVGEPGFIVALTIVLGVVVEFESDSFSPLPVSSLS